MRYLNWLGVLAVYVLGSGISAADSTQHTDQEQAADRFMKTFCVTDRGLITSGGTARPEGSAHFSHNVQLDNKQFVVREYDVSWEELYTAWRDAYAELLTQEELKALLGFCRSDNEALRNALKKQRQKAAARRFMATMKVEIAQNPSLAPFESGIIVADKRPEYELSQAETQALTELDQSVLAQSGIDKMEKIYKRASAKLWQIGKERWVDTPRR